MGQLFLAIGLLLLVTHVSALTDTPCGDWELYKDEKCFKIFENVGLQPYTNASSICVAKGGTLISIHSAEEQHFLNQFIFNQSKVVDNVWLGGFYAGGHFKWKDTSEFTFTNWASGHPKNHDDFCVQMHSDPDSIGKWVDEYCTKKYAVVCQKTPTVTTSQLMELFLELKRNPVPLGFIYTQLPRQPAPIELWPWMLWEDISVQYAGLFFRSAGGDSAPFGQTQPADTIRIDTIFWDYHQHSYPSRNPGHSVSIAADGYTSIANEYDISNLLVHSHSPPHGDVRPKNTAVRIWKRVK